MVGGEEITGAGRIPEMRVQLAHPGLGVFQEALVARDFEQLRRRQRHVGIVVGKSFGAMLAAGGGVIELAAVAQGGDHGVECDHGLGDPFAAFQHHAGAGQRGDGQAVPVGQHLVVARRRRALAPRLQQHAALLGHQQFVGVGGRLRARAGAARHIAAVEVALAVDVVDGFELGREGAD